MFTLPRESIITKAMEEKKPIMADPLIIEAVMEVLPVTTKAWSGEVVGVATPTIVGFLAV